MILGVVGLGLIGGSFAKAYVKSGWQVLACDVDTAMLEFAKLSGAVHGTLTEENLKTCDLLLLCTYPQAAEDYLKSNAHLISSHTVVIDCLGTKKTHLRGCLPSGKTARLLLCRRSPHGRHPQFRLQVRTGQSVPGRTHGHRAAGV